MKKLVLLFIFLIFSLLFVPAKADILPMSTKSIKYYGIGVLNMPKSYTVYQYPYRDSKILREFNYDNLTKSSIVNSVDMRKVSYVTYLPKDNLALLTVEMNPGNNWYNVYLNQDTGETGWVYNDEKNVFYTYKQLFSKYGKKNGIRMFNDLTNDEKVLYAKESTASKIIDEMTYPKHITYTVIRGNWMLITVSDMGKQPKVGWFNWRRDDGTLKMFPNFK